jgi:hypothetical protein
MWRVALAYCKLLPSIALAAILSSPQTIARRFRLTFPVPPEGVTVREGQVYPSGRHVPAGTVYRWTDRHGVEKFRIVRPDGSHLRIPPEIGVKLLARQRQLHWRNRIALALVVLSLAALLTVGLWW